MVVGAKRSIFTACPPSPARSVLNPQTEEWILGWLTDLSAIYPDLLDDLPGYAKALCKVGYKTFASLNFMHLEFQGDGPCYGGQGCAQDQRRACKGNRRRSPRTSSA